MNTSDTAGTGGQAAAVGAGQTDTALLTENSRLANEAAAQKKRADDAEAALTKTQTDLTALTATVGALTTRVEAAEKAKLTVDEAAAAQTAQHGIRKTALGSTTNGKGTEAAQDEALMTEFMSLKGREKSAFYAKHSDRLNLLSRSAAVAASN